MKKALFSLGVLLETPGARDSFTDDEKAGALARHVSGDWGDLAPEDRAANDAAIQAEERIVSAYVFGDRKLWIITEADRACTTLLLPEEN
jgi:hypothetical protein